MSERDPEERATYVVLILAGLLPLVAAVLAGGRAGAGVTICFLMLAAGVTGLMSGTWSGRDRDVPPAQEVRRSTRPQTR
jgi:VIT1/CCC1 family predicted Fe2+/Mn2+ transporter